MSGNNARRGPSQPAAGAGGDKASAEKRNTPLLILSAVCLLAWLLFLAWMALTE